MEASPQEEMGFLKISSLFVLYVECNVATRICAESVDCLGSATVVSTRRYMCFRFTFS